VVLVFRDQSEERLAKKLTEIRLSLTSYATSHPLDDLLTKALDEISTITESPIGFYHFVDEDQKTLSLQQWSTRTLNEFCNAKGKGKHYGFDKAGVWIDSVREKKPVIHNDYEALSHKKGMPEGHAKIIRELTIPVMREEKVVAILGVGNKPSDYTEKDLEIAAHLADTTWDIVLQKRMIEALFESENKWKNILVSTPQIGISIDPDERIIFANDFFLKFTGWEAHEVLGKNWFDLFIPEKIRNEIRNVFNAVMHSRDTLGYSSYENDIVTMSGELRSVAWSNVISKDTHGNITDVTCLGIDITERKRSEDALRRSDQKFRELFNSITDLIYTQDLEGRFLTVNPAMHTLFGYADDEFIGRKAADFMKPELRELFITEYLENLKSQGHYEGISSYFKKDGGKIYIEFRSKLVNPEHGQSYISGIGRDVTERILAEKVQNSAEEERERLQAQLVQSQKMESVGRLAGGVAHDFNNMLGVILGHAEIAMEKAGFLDPIRTDLEEILKAAKRSADLTRHLLAFARKEIIRPRVLDLNDTVSGMLKMLRRLIGEDIHLIWMPGAELWPVKIDPAQIDQVLANLCVNARDAITGVGKINIETQNIVFDDAYCNRNPGFNPGAYVMLAVSDDGCGMNKETLEHLFEPFFTTKDVGKGTGLGLATIYGIVKQNSGFINVYSEPGIGTTIKLYFPKTSEAAETGPDPAAKIPKGGTETMLLV
ncbi:MAG: PAS domain S-box protein, partial [Thermodesulfobacteriota bacterium]